MRKLPSSACRAGTRLTWSVRRSFRLVRRDADREADKPFVFRGERELFVGEHVRAHDGSVSLWVVEIHRSVVRLVEVSDDAIGELDLVKRLTVDRHCSGDLRGSSGELRADGFDGVDQRRRLGAWLLVDRLRARVVRVVDRAFSRTFVELTRSPFDDPDYVWRVRLLPPLDRDRCSDRLHSGLLDVHDEVGWRAHRASHIGEDRGVRRRRATGSACSDKRDDRYSGRRRSERR